MSEQRELPAKPIGAVASLSAGLDTVIQGWWILLFPLALDLFLWLGPRLSIRPVTEEFLATMAPLMEGNPVLDMIQTAAAELNYFSTVSITPLGVPSLMSIKLPQSTPLGTPTTYLVTDDLQWVGLFFCFSLSGLLLGGIYFGLITQQVRDGAPHLWRLLRVMPGYWLSVLLLIITLLLVGAILAVPVIIVAALLSGLSAWIATLVIWTGFMLFLWLVFHLFFTIHGILLNQQSLVTAAWNSLRLVAANSFSVMGLLALVFAISAGLNFLWSLPNENSWMLLVGIAGHALISSALVAATFVFFQDRYRYWRQVQDYFAQRRKDDISENY
jgi:hypothetical protein